MLIDTHAHLDSFVREGTLDAVLARAASAGVGRVIAMGGNPESNELALRLPSLYPNRVASAVGLNRDWAGAPERERRVEEVRARLRFPGVVAVGEVGLDFYYEAESADAQQVLFRQMAGLARDAGLPLLVHCRDAEEETLSILREHVRALGGGARIGVLHCFTGDPSFARHVVDLGMYISFSGMLTFRNADRIREAAAAVPEDRLLIETDTPYLAPTPHRGRPNEPALLEHTAAELARIRGWSREVLEGILSQNAARLFGWEA